MPEARRRGWSALLVLLLLLVSLSWAMAGEASPATSLLDQVVALNQIQEPELDREALRRDFLALCAKARPGIAAAETTRDKIAALNQVLLAERKVSYLSNLYWRDATLASAVLRGKGNCLSTSTLYVLVGEELGLPIHLVIVPRHAFVRWDDGKERINIETTAQGREIPDASYVNSIESGERLAMQFGDSLDRAGFIAELTEAGMNHRFSAGDLQGAGALLVEVERLAPWRSDLRLHHIALNADITKDRQAARDQMAALLRQNPSASVITGALCWLAEDAGARRLFTQQRGLLLEAFRYAPRAQIARVLMSLAFCHRTLKDWRGAVRYFELSMACDEKVRPERADELYNYAILLKNDGRLSDALLALDQALKLNPEKWNVTVLKAGYLCLAGKMEEGKALYATVAQPRVDAEFWFIMQAWFSAVTAQREDFYRLFALALEKSNSEHVLTWVDQDVDLDPYRNDAEFQRLIALHRARLLGEATKP